MKNKVFIILFCVLVFGTAAFRAHAEVFSANLYYNASTKTLAFDKLKGEKISLDKEKFVSVFDFSDETKVGTYVAVLYDNKENELIRGYFNPPSGSFSLDIPYVSVASSLKIYAKATMKEILKADLSSFVSCNRNGTCEFEKGENNTTCILDCASSAVNFSEETKKTLEEHGGVIKDEKTGEILLQGTQSVGTSSQNKSGGNQNESNKTMSIIIIAVIVMLSVGVVFFIVRKKVIKR